MDEVKIIDINKSEFDKCEYRGLELPNKLQVVLIRDAETNKSSACMAVNVGHLLDPAELPGLAHFLEHMLFLGTDKYPEENAYSEFIKKHGGNLNAVTKANCTQFFFDVASDHFIDALDIFVQFFISPLFNENAKDRELTAVNNEHLNNIKIDAWRKQQINRSLADPKHPYNNFSTGNKDTLSTDAEKLGYDVLAELKKFYHTHYSSNLMKLAIVSNHSLDTLQEVVIEKFSAICNKEIPLEVFNSTPYLEDSLQTITKWVPIKDVQSLELHFQIKDYLEYFRIKPGNYISHLIGHESEGSLFFNLKESNWAVSLVAGELSEARGLNNFKITISLTELGKENYEDVIVSVFQYIELLKKSEHQKWIYDECAKLSKLYFLFNEKSHSIVTTSKISSVMLKYPIENVLDGVYMMEKFDLALITEYLTQLTLSNCRILYGIKENEAIATIEEKWYKTKYKCAKITEELSKRILNPIINPNFHLPKINPYIPSNFEILPPQDEIKALPEIILSEPYGTLYYKQDDTFFFPKSCIYMNITLLYSLQDPEYYVMTVLVFNIVNDLLNEISYDAYLAELSYSLEDHSNCIQFKMQGYNEKQKELFQVIMDKIGNAVFTEEKLLTYKEHLLKNLKNHSKSEPIRLVSYYLTQLIQNSIWQNEELIEALADVNLEKLIAYHKMLFTRIYVEFLIQGNTSKDEAKSYFSLFRDTFKANFQSKPLIASQLTRPRAVKLLPNTCQHYITQSTTHDNNAVLIYYQIGLSCLTESNAAKVFNQLISDPLFDSLRTKQQLAYHIANSVARLNGVISFVIVIQSNEACSYLEEKIEEFVANFEQVLNDMEEKTFTEYVEAVITKLEEKPKQIADEANRHWNEIFQGEYNFNRRKYNADYLREEMSKQKLIDFYKKYISAKSPERKKLVIYVCSSSSDLAQLKVYDSENSEIIQDMVTFKRNRYLYPLLPVWSPDSFNTKSKL